MSYIDIAVLVILVLSALLGLLKGFYKTFFGFIATAVSFVIVYFITGPITKSLVGIGAIEGFIQGPLTKMMEAMKFLIGDPTYFATLFFTIIVFFALFAVVRLLMMIVTVVLKNLTRDKKVTGISRLLGFVVGAAKGGLSVAVLLVISMTFSGALPLKYQNELYGDGSITSKYVGKYVYKYTNEFVLKQVGIIFGDDDDPAEDAAALAEAQTALAAKKAGVTTELNKIMAKSDWLYNDNGQALDILLGITDASSAADKDALVNMKSKYAAIEGAVSENLLPFIAALPNTTVSQCQLSTAIIDAVEKLDLAALTTSFTGWAMLVETYSGDYAAVVAAFALFEENGTAFLAGLESINPSLVPVA